ncbi:hypothetical protein GCM10010247_29450 [Streptomyces calvus]|nr:hypothetical protein GCM10010247_29450 [Streptomyces calvus]
MLAALRTLITDALAGTAEDMPEEGCPLPEDLGATVAIGYDDQGVLHSLYGSQVRDSRRRTDHHDHHQGGRVTPPSQGLRHRRHAPTAARAWST